jgi:hypothetical protein
MEKGLPSLENSKRPLCIICQNGWHITWCTQPKRKVLRLESQGYNKSYSGRKPTISPRFDERKPFPYCCKFSLDSPKYCMYIIHFLPNVLPGPRLSWSPIIAASRVPSRILPGALIALVPSQGRSNTKIVLSISPPCQYDLTCDFMYPSCSIIQENISSLIAPMIDPVCNLRKYLTLEFEKVLLHSKHLLELLDQEHRVMKCNMSRVMKHNLILQGAMSHTHRRKNDMDDRKVLLSTVLISFLLHGQSIFHYFLCPLLHKSPDEIAFKGGGL